MRSVPDAYCMLQVLVHENCTRYILHVTGVSTWELYQMQIACYRRSLLLLILTVDTKHFVIVLFYSDFVFQTSIVSAEFGSSHFCWVICSLGFFAIDAVQGELGLENSADPCSSLTVRLRLWPKSSTHNLSIWLKCFDNCHTRTQLLNIVLYTTKSFSIFSCNQNLSYYKNTNEKFN